jgi:hypothetical protein
MLADCPLEMPAALHDFARASARMYPEFVRELEDESGLKIDLRPVGTLFFASEEHPSLETSLSSAPAAGRIGTGLAGSGARACMPVSEGMLR